MTFTEAAIEVLRREGKPLHFRKIAEIAAREDLLDHVGKIPEETMADQLAAHCRLPKSDRRVVAVQHGTFALVEWGLDEDPAGIENLVEPPPEGELPYRSNERHPIPSREVARATGRGEGRGRRREEAEERRPKRFPPPAEVAYEILAGAGKPLPLQEIAAQGAERLLMPDAFVRDGASLRAALLEDNRRREAAGRQGLFALEGDAVTLVAQPEPGERGLPAPAPALRAVTGAGAADLRKAALAALRRRLREADGPTFEHLAVALLERLGYHEVKVAKRGREHAVYTARRRLGLADLRHVVRVLRGQGDAGKRDVVDLRRDLGNYGAQIGVVISAGDAHRDARGDAAAAGQLPVVLLCGDALAEAAAEAQLGCRPVVVPEVDEDFFREAAAKGAEEEAARRVRREERDRREGREGRRGEERRREPGAPGPVAAAVPAEVDVEGAPESEAPPPGEEAGDAPVEAEAEAEAVEPRTVMEVPAVIEVEAEDEGEGEEADEEDGPEEAEEGAATPREAAGPGSALAEGGEGRRRRRRRRRRRGGRGRREGGPVEGAPAAGEGSPANAAGAGTGAEPAGERPQPQAAAPRGEPGPGGDGSGD